MIPRHYYPINMYSTWLAFPRQTFDDFESIRHLFCTLSLSNELFEELHFSNMFAVSYKNLIKVYN